MRAKLCDGVVHGDELPFVDGGLIPGGSDRAGCAVSVECVGGPAAPPPLGADAGDVAADVDAVGPAEDLEEVQLSELAVLVAVGEPADTRPGVPRRSRPDDVLSLLQVVEAFPHGPCFLVVVPKLVLVLRLIRVLQLREEGQFTCRRADDV